MIIEPCFTCAFGEPMILETLVKYDRIGIFCGKKLQSGFALLRFTMFTCCDSKIPLALPALVKSACGKSSMAQEAIVSGERKFKIIFLFHF